MHKKKRKCTATSAINQYKRWQLAGNNTNTADEYKPIATDLCGLRALHCDCVAWRW